MGELTFFVLNSKGKYVFIWGKDDDINAEKAALSCTNFKLDVEEEWVSDINQICYNCRYRRWTAESFVCMKKS